MYDKEDKSEKRARLMDERDEYGMEFDDSYEPTGALAGSVYCCTGVFENITREKLEVFIQKQGGTLSKSFSGKV